MQPFIRAYDCGIILVVRILGAVAEAILIYVKITCKENEKTGLMIPKLLIIHWPFVSVS